MLSSRSVAVAQRLVKRPATFLRPFSSFSSASNRGTNTESDPSFASNLNRLGSRHRDDSLGGATRAYESPLQDIFDAMLANGPTTLGTTQEDIDFEKEMAKNEKKLGCGIPERVLRFKTTSYGRTLVAPHVHGNEHQVVVKMHTKYLPLDATEMEILREIVGNRLNDERRELRLTSNQFGSRIENKRHLVSMLDRIVLSCQRMGADLRQQEQNKQETA